MTALEYFNQNALYVAEIEHEDGYRFWSEAMPLAELSRYIDRKCKLGYYLSDIDLTKQTNTFCKRVVDLAQLNWFKNQTWCKRHDLNSLDSVISFICENDLWRP